MKGGSWEVLVWQALAIAVASSRSGADGVFAALLPLFLLLVFEAMTLFTLFAEDIARRCDDVGRAGCCLKEIGQYSKRIYSDRNVRQQIEISIDKKIIWLSIQLS